MKGFGQRFILRLRLLILSFEVGVASTAVALVVVGLWVVGLQPLSVVAAGAWLAAILPWLFISIAIGADVVLLIVAKGTVFVPLFRMIGETAERDREITKRPEEPLSRISKVAFYVNPLMPLTVGTAAFLENRPVLEGVVQSFHDAMMLTPRRSVRTLSEQWVERRIRGDHHVHRAAA